MKKRLVFVLALAMTLSLAACGGKDEPAAATTATTAATSAATTAATTAAEEKTTPAEEAEFTAEQAELAQKYLDMTEEYDKIVDRLNNSPEALADEELVDTMNQLAEEIIAADEYFADPETLTPEVMEALETSIEAVNEFIVTADTALNELEQAAKDAEEEEVQALVVPVEIINETGVDIYALALSPANVEEWGDNLITEVIATGESAQGELVFTADTLVWDILVQDGEENQVTFMGVDFTEASVEGAKLLLGVTEAGEYYAQLVE